MKNVYGIILVSMLAFNSNAEVQPPQLPSPSTNTPMQAQPQQKPDLEKCVVFKEGKNIIKPDPSMPTNEEPYLMLPKDACDILRNAVNTNNFTGIPPEVQARLNVVKPTEPQVMPQNMKIPEKK